MEKLLTHIVFEEQAAGVPEKIAIEEGDRKVSYQQLNRRANQLARQLRTGGLQAGGIAGVVLGSSTNLVTSLLGSFKAQGVYLPISLSFPARRLKQIFTQTCPQVLITDQQHAPQLEALLAGQDLQVPMVVLPVESEQWREWSQEPTNEWDHNLSLPISGEDSSYIFYTSGSSGEAKAILGKHESLSHFMHWQIKEFATEQSVRVSQLIAVTFDASLRDIFLPLMTGGTLCIPPSGTNTNTTALVEWLEWSRVELMHCVPSVFRLLTQELRQGPRRQSLPDLRFILLAGEALYGKDVADWREYVGGHAEVVNLYGTTETTLIKFFYRVGELPVNKAQVIPVGKPIDDTMVAVINHDLPCGPREIGEVYIKTPFTTKGYINNALLQQAVFVPNPLSNDPTDIVYRTGDLGRLLPEGNLEILGRLDEQVKVNGVRIELEEVRRAVLEVEGVREAVLLSLKDDNHNLSLVCYYTGSLLEETAIREHLEQAVDSHALPAHFVRLDKFPLTLNGKVNKKELPRPHVMLVSGYSPVVTPLEKQLETIWQEVLGLERIGRKASFFRIGGTSLKAIQIMSRMYKKFQVLVTIKDMFAYPTIEQLASLISEGVRKYYEEIKPVAWQEYYPVSHAQKRLWILHQFDHEQTAYNISESYVLEGGLQPLILQQALHAVVARHESLRTVFIVHQGEPYQKICPPETFDYRFEQVDLHDSQQSEEQLAKLSRQEANREFDLESGPLLRTSLIQLQKDKYVFLFTIHHIISDGWSMQLLMREIALLYNSFCRGEHNPLAPLTIQYKDYAAWQNQQLSGPIQHYHQEYWHKQFAGELPQLNLPTDFPRPDVKTNKAKHLSYRLDETLSKELNILSSDHEASLFMTLLAALKIILYKQSGQTDLVVGSPIADRHHINLEDQVGNFLNTVVLRTRLNPRLTFSQILECVKEVALGAYTHELYPFDLLVSTLGVKRQQNRNPLFDVGFSFHNQNGVSSFGVQAALMGKSHVSFQDFAYTDKDPVLSEVKTDLWLHGIEFENALSLTICYNTSLFTETYAKKFMDQYISLLTEVVGNLHEPIDSLIEILQQKQYLVQRNNQKSITDWKMKTLVNAIDTLR
jgi:mycobactin peptide synthetase MbtE